MRDRVAAANATMSLLRKLTRVLRQQYLGALALFVALGGSAYAAATINSSNVVDDSLTGADIKGRAGKPGKPFTQGTITGEDVKGSAAARGRPAVNGGLTGLDIANGSITGADIFRGTVPNSSKLGGAVPSAYGTTTRTSHQQVADCADATYNQCAKVTVTVPPGRHYRATVYSSFTVQSSLSSAVFYCPAVRSASLPLTCLSGQPPPGADIISLGANYAESGAASGDTSALGFDLGAGTWTFSTLLSYQGTVNLFDGPRSAHTTVVVTDATGPSPTGVSGSSGSSGTCGTSGQTSGGTSGQTSGGTSGNTSGGTSGSSGC